MKSRRPVEHLREAVTETLEGFDRVLSRRETGVRTEEIGVVTFVGEGIARVSGLGGARLEELVRFPGNVLGMVFNLDPDEVGVVLLDKSERFRVGAQVRRTGRVLDVPVGEALLGRVVDALGRPVDGGGPIRTARRRPIERPAAGIMDRAGVTVPLLTGIKAVDALIPIGRGQRELILGDRQTGKTAIALDTILNQRETGVLCIYCAVGQRGGSTAKLIADLRKRGAMDYSLVMVAPGDDPPGLQFSCPYAAMSVAEAFMEDGHDVLVVFDDLTRHAQAYRELSLLLRRPPGREAFPGDIFYIHSRLLERATRLRPERGGGSVTALPIIETEGQNMSAYIPTNLISITDGQVYLSPALFRKGHLPAVDIGKSVSRVGGKAQLPAFRAVAGRLRLSYSQFEELEAFARFGTRLDEDSRRTLEHGRRVRETLKQPQYLPLPAAEQMAILLVVAGGLLDSLPVDKVPAAEAGVRRAVAEKLPEVCRRIEQGEHLAEGDRTAILELAVAIVQEMSGGV